MKKRCLLPLLLLPLAALAQPSIYNDAQSLVTGTWQGNGTLAQTSAGSPYEGSNHYRFGYNFSDWWAGFGLNMDSWGSGPARDFSGYTHLRLAYRGLSAGQSLNVVLRNGGDFGNTIEVGPSMGSYGLVDIPLLALTVGTNVAAGAVRELNFNVSSNTQTGSGEVYVDAISLVNISGGPSGASASTWARANSISKGVNLSNWLEAYWLLPFNAYPETNRYTQARVQALRDAGFDVIRMPVIFERLGSTTAPYDLDFNHPAFALVDNLILWAEQMDFKLVIDNHHGLPLTNANYNSELPRLKAVWRQLAQRYGNLDPERYFFELYNEPFEISNNNFRTVADALVAEIRQHETERHSIFVGGNGYNSGSGLIAFTPLSDPDIIYTFHCYDPYFFTHQGMSWTNPAFFPQRSFPQAGEVAALQQLMGSVSSWGSNYDVPVSLGEFGVSTAADATSRCNWIEAIMAAVNANGFSYIYWDAISPNDAFGFYNGGIINASNVIPCFSTALGLNYALSLTLEAFESDCSGEQATLRWEAQSNSGNGVFVLQASDNGHQWLDLAETKARLGSHSYQLEAPELRRYYRLKMVEADGQVRYSPMLKSACLADNALALYPNPANVQSLLSLPEDAKQALEQVAVTDLAGRILWQRSYAPEQDMRRVQVPVQQLPNGMYQVLARLSNGVQAHAPLIVQH
jgi:endoglucanase